MSGELAAALRHLKKAYAHRPGLAETTAAFQAQLEAERLQVEQEYQTLVDTHHLN